MSYLELSLSVCMYNISVSSLLHPNILQNHVIFLFNRSQMIPSLFPMHFSMWLNILVIIVLQFCWDHFCKRNFLNSLLLPLNILCVSQQTIQILEGPKQQIPRSVLLFHSVDIYFFLVNFLFCLFSLQISGICLISLALL